MNEVSFWREVAELLQSYGGWPVACVFAYLARFFYMAREHDRKERDKEKQSFNDRLLSMSLQQGDVLRKASDNQSLLLSALQKTQGED